jgi:hypothetical protein
MGTIARLVLIAGVLGSAGYGVYDLCVWPAKATPATKHAAAAASKAASAKAGSAKPTSAKSDTPAGIPRGERPETRGEVFARFGAPLIATADNINWRYDGFNVVFSGDKVVGWVSNEGVAASQGKGPRKVAHAAPRSGSAASGAAVAGSHRVIRASGQGGVVYRAGRSAAGRSSVRNGYELAGGSQRFRVFRPDSAFNFNNRRFVNNGMFNQMFDQNSSLTRSRR